MTLNSIEEIIADIQQGRMVILMDDEDRENEGDLIMAASYVRPDDINFMARYGRGLICLTLTEQRCKQLNLPLMVANTGAKHATNFTISIEASSGVTTGISAADRAQTVLAAVARDAKPEDIEQPGHIFPLMAQPGGVLTRAGHTEAGCDLARLAGLEPASVIVEILNDDGTMARRPDLEVFAEQHQLKIGTVADLIRFRIKNESTIERVAESAVTTEFGDFQLLAYRDTIAQELDLALVYGDLTSDKVPMVRVHLPNTLCDVLRLRRSGCGDALTVAMQKIVAHGCGIVILLGKQQDDNEIVRRIRNFQFAEGASPTESMEGEDLRTYGVGAQILADLQVHQMVVLGSRKKLHGLAGFGLEILDYLPLDKQ